MSEQRDYVELLELFYQCPIGIVETDSAGAVRKLNPASARMLAPFLLDARLDDMAEILARTAPTLAEELDRDPDRLGRLGDAHRLTATDGRDECVEIHAIRVAPSRVMFVLNDVTAEHRLVAREHAAAVTLQSATLGRIDEGVPGADSALSRAAVRGYPAGGDWFDVIGLLDGCLGLVLGDVVGHDVRASATMGQLRSVIRALADFSVDPAELIAHADRHAATIAGAECATVAFVRLDPWTGELRYACAGQPPPLVLPARGTPYFLLEGRGAPLTVPWPRPRAGSARLDPDDVLLLYSDGLYERHDIGADPLARLARTVSRFARLEPDELVQRLVDEMLDGDPAHDDVCVLAYRPPIRARRRDAGRRDVTATAQAAAIPAR